MTPILLESALPIIGARGAHVIMADDERADERVPAPPVLTQRPKARVFYRVAGYIYTANPGAWHDNTNLHAHLACSVIRSWQRGRYRGAGRKPKVEREYPPKPPTLVAEIYDPLEVPRSLRCNYCCGPLLELPDQIWHPSYGDPWHAMSPDGYWHCSPAQVADWRLQVHLAMARWRSFTGGLTGRAFLVWDGREFAPTGGLAA